MTAKIVIRPAERRDLDELVAMAAEFDAFLRGIEAGDPPFDDAKATSGLERFAFGKAPLCTVLIAEQEATAVGYAIYSLGFWADAWEGMLFLTDLFVREAWRSQGVGRRLMQELTAIGRKEGCQRIMWTVWTENAEARQFYRALGAEEIAEERLMTWPIRAK